VAVAAGVIQEADADASLTEALAAALEANERLARLAGDLRAENTRLREENARLREELARRGAPGTRIAMTSCRGGGAAARRQAVVVLVDLLGLMAGGLPVPGAREEPPGAERADVGGRVWLQALQDVLGQAR
jgi:hypothetical protein